MGKKNIAVQLFGHVRTFDKVSKSFFKNLVNPILDADYNVDIFIHTWDELDSCENRDFYPKDMEKAGKKLTQQQKELINTTYQPKGILIEPQLTLSTEEKRRSDKQDVLRRKNVAHSFCGVNRLRQKYEKEHNVNYDLVITTRPDIEFIEPFTNIYQFKNKQENWGYYKNIDNCFFSSYITKVRSVTAYEDLIAGIDLLLFASDKVMNEIIKWEDDFNSYIEYKPEMAITKIFAQANFKHNVMEYEKDRCWRIHRFGEKTTIKNKLATKFYKLVMPILKYSPLYLSHIAFCSTKYTGTLKSNLSWFLNMKVK